MKLYINLTSPFARIVRIALIEMGLDRQVTTQVVDPWTDEPGLMAANPAGRVPTLVTQDGVALSETMLILQYLAALAPQAPLLPAEGPECVLARAGLAIGTIEAAAAIIIGCKSAPDFDTQLVGQRRYRTMRDGLARIDRNLPPDMTERLDLSAIATVVALDYIVFRFPAIDWLGANPALAAWRLRQGERPSLVATKPGG